MPGQSVDVVISNCVINLSDDKAAVLAIYQAGLDTGQASFETVAPSWEGFEAGKLPHLRLVAVDTETGEVVGWAAASPVSSRPVYAGVVEHSVYVHPAARPTASAARC
ncbi:hypothetical protein [Nonomuraea sp. NPDC046570]|uniref:GNAT family N-acetyltransferase n=1 Tax=Nonomuraea sp. NPDC046570 TaxID=3155255 RepID=UPI0033F4359A